MSRHRRLYLKPGLLQQFNFASMLPLFMYSTIIFLICLGDAIMSYFSPVYIQSKVENTFYMGAIISFSSIVGLISDSVLCTYFKGKKYHFFLSGAIAGAIAFPLTFLLFGKWIAALLLAMAVWGVYFEFMLFANFFAIQNFVSQQNHAFGWGVLKTFQAVSYAVGPLIASALLDFSITYTLIAVSLIQALALISFFFFYREHRPRMISQNMEEKRGFRHQLLVWRLLLPKIWPIVLFELVLTLVDAAFWNVGSVLAESWQGQHHLGGLLLTVYMIPSLFMGVFAGVASKPYGKKRAAFISGLLGGLILAVAGIVNNITIFVGMVFISSILTALTVPEVLGTIEDYVERLGKNSSELVGLENSTISAAYIIGPIAAGGIAALIGNQQTFTVMGSLLFIVSLVSLFIVPRKIHMPQQKISQLP